MLDPTARHLYLEKLRPPTECRLDYVVGTTYSLDLLTLLMLPLSSAMFECESADQALRDPTALLEALERMTGKLSVFCQRGRIAVPATQQLLFSYLEPMVVEVVLPSSSGSLHAKTWLMRFIGPDNQIIYRFICLSRNLTFNRFWDTALVLEGELQDRKVGYGRNRSLSDFVAYLPTLACTPVSERTRGKIETMSEEVRRVSFEPPPELENEKDWLAFWPVGIPDHRRFLIKGRVDRLLIVSPFLTGGRIRRMTDNQTECILVSREESVDELDEDARARFSEILVMDDAVMRHRETIERITGEKDTGEAEGTQTQEPDLSSLHAKLYVADAGWKARLWTGSANATHSAFSGRNVEFMVELRGKRSNIGIDAILGHDEHRTTFRDLLRSYVPPSESPPENPERRALEERVESLRQGIVTSDLHLFVHRVKDGDSYDLVLRMDSQAPLSLHDGIDGRCWPITLEKGYAQDLRALLSNGEVAFRNLSTVAVTRFIAFELTGRSGSLEHSTRFALNLPIDNIPDDRDNHILRSILSDKNRFVRYLLLLLSEDATSVWLAELHQHTDLGTSGQAVPLLGASDLAEKLVRTYSRAPDKLDRVAKLVDDLCKTPEGRQLLPEGFEELWRVIWKAKLELKR
jgi:hypothetical protein